MRSAPARPSGCGLGYNLYPSSVTSSLVRQRRVLIVATLAIVLVLAAVIASMLRTQPDAPAATPTQAPTATAPATEQPGAGQPPVVERRDPNDLMAIGAVDAPVVLVEWADMRCPYCALVATQTLPDVIEKYVDTGKVRIEFRDVSFFGEQSTDAAVALRAASEQGRFREFLETVFAAAPDKGHADLPRTRLVELAGTAGVPDLARFESDLAREDLHAAVAASTTTAQQLGVSSVPFFVVNGTAFAGAQPLETFTQVLDEALAAAGA